MRTLSRKQAINWLRALWLLLRSIHSNPSKAKRFDSASSIESKLICIELTFFYCILIVRHVKRSQKSEQVAKRARVGMSLSLCKCVRWLSTCMRGAMNGEKCEATRTTPYKFFFVWVWTTRHAAVVSCQFVHIYFKIDELWRSVVNCCWDRPDVLRRSEGWPTRKLKSGKNF